ncbi:MAG: hypothetical protein R2822_29510 [Spirosomataceae bacterium]
MNNLYSIKIGLLVFLGFSCGFAQKIPVNYDESKIPPYTLPNPLVLPNGQRIKTASDWEKTGRPAVLQRFAAHIYGLNPFPNPVKIEAEVRCINQNALGGKAVS